MEERAFARRLIQVEGLGIVLLTKLLDLVRAEEMRWTEPVRPGDTLRTEIEVVGVRLAKSRPDYGIVTTTTKCINQRDQVVLRATVNFLAPLRAEKA